MKLEYTPRAFRLALFKDRCGVVCSIQESSSVVPSLWLGVDSNRMHLSQEMVKALLPLLTHFTEHGVLPEPRKCGKSKKEGK